MILLVCLARPRMGQLQLSQILWHGAGNGQSAQVVSMGRRLCSCPSAGLAKLTPISMLSSVRAGCNGHIRQFLPWHCHDRVIGYLP